MIFFYWPNIEFDPADFMLQKQLFPIWLYYILLD